MPAAVIRRIRERIDSYARSPALAADVVKLKGREGYRLRVGGYRVIFRRDSDRLSILDIGPRGDIY